MAAIEVAIEGTAMHRMVDMGSKHSLIHPETVNKFKTSLDILDESVSVKLCHTLNKNTTVKTKAYIDTYVCNVLYPYKYLVLDMGVPSAGL